mmetsp:Transcript_86202/g.279009  ORF Transcript_86202/g.279009 Transcript_86202/m.279009 type:complete len:259 (-) Transcript_86202:141-917(-)
MRLMAEKVDMRGKVSWKSWLMDVKAAYSEPPATKLQRRQRACSAAQRTQETSTKATRTAKVRNCVLVSGSGMCRTRSSVSWARPPCTCSAPVRTPWRRQTSSTKLWQSVQLRARTLATLNSTEPTSTKNQKTFCWSQMSPMRSMPPSASRRMCRRKLGRSSACTFSYTTRARSSVVKPMSLSFSTSTVHPASSLTASMRVRRQDFTWRLMERHLSCSCGVGCLEPPRRASGSSNVPSARTLTFRAQGRCALALHGEAS